ncbi:alkanesulfonate monooxygenase [Parafrankia irregularis]|uniref:Alkanesulfonate monooxygenase n=1 Tax=Parafrankia irregularis TaxID=795642 RepID=A0A0S4QQZ3_9ACTN|nr:MULTISPECIES: LLM class flavin-dependent oxidoreductase [Parafrankia]MBE3199864.1 LLM class flavin-dependent oxidoreductase [Parafrankia sp. CH37]CUU58017.1 alkanesulfonate monooxygenase [Parafrankia irregularis]
MSVEFIGMVSTSAGSESQGSTGPVVDPDYLDGFVRAHEEAGFDRVLVAHASFMPDGFVVADQILARSKKLGVLLAHRPGFVAPTIAARKYATIDAFNPGRIALHVITGGDDADQARDGDLTDKATRYRRTDEFLDILRREWESAAPFDYDGDFYQIRGAWSAVRPPAGRIPIYFGGASDDAVRVGGKHADVYAFWGEPLAGIVERIRQVRAAAAPYGRDPRFSVSLRPIPADTEQAAWDRAAEILELTRERSADIQKFLKGSEQVGSQRLLKYADEGDVHDKRLWTAIAKVTGAVGNSTALVGSYEQVAEALVDYVNVGVSTLLIRGFDPVADARDYGSLVKLVHERTADRDPVTGSGSGTPAVTAPAAAPASV